MDRTEILDEEYERRGWIEKFKSMFAHGDDMDEEEEYDAGPAIRSVPRQAPAAIRPEHGRGNAIYTRLTFRGMQDAQAAADRLKERRAVIVNFERTDEDVARRGVDFISGVTYALDGFYEKVGEKVFLFTPNNTAIVADDADPSERGAGYGAYDGSR